MSDVVMWILRPAPVLPPSCVEEAVHGSPWRVGAPAAAVRPCRRQHEVSVPDPIQLAVLLSAFR
jgi:hypothetical protein